MFRAWPVSIDICVRIICALDLGGLDNEFSGHKRRNAQSNERVSFERNLYEPARWSIHCHAIPQLGELMRPDTRCGLCDRYLSVAHSSNALLLSCCAEFV